MADFLTEQRVLFSLCLGTQGWWGDVHPELGTNMAKQFCKQNKGKSVQSHFMWLGLRAGGKISNSQR